MVDADLVAKKLAFIETCVRELHEVALPELIEHDIREQRFVVHTLQLAIQSALDVASHLVSDRRLGEPRTNRELFELLGRAGLLEEGQVESLRDMAGFRNVVVHGYQALDLRVVRDVVDHHLDDLLGFARTIRQGIRED